MSKQEFLQELRERLLAEGADGLVSENLSYYERYIDSETAKGRSEDEVIEELGGANAIAHSILEAAGYTVDGIPDVRPGTSGRAGSTEGQADNSSGYADGENETQDSASGRSGRGPFGGRGGDSLRRILWTVLFIFIVLMLLTFFIYFVGLFWPVILVLILAWWIYSTMNRRW